MRVLITGAASGLGAALTGAFRARGDDVLATDLPSPARPALGHPVHASTPAEVRGLDVTSDDDWAAALDHVEQSWGGLDILVNNAGVAGGGRIEFCGLDEWEWITDINLFGAVRGTRTFVPMLKEQGSGHIVNIASLAGLVHPAGMGSYNAVKAALVAFSETARHELAGEGINVSVVCPSYFRTNLAESMRGADRAVASVLGRLVETSPTSAEEIATEVLAGVADGEFLILPDPAARQAYALKLTDRAAYDELLQAQAAKLQEAGK